MARAGWVVARVVTLATAMLATLPPPAAPAAGCTRRGASSRGRSRAAASTTPRGSRREATEIHDLFRDRKFRPPLSFVDCIGYAASSAGLFKSHDDGVPWEPIEAQ